MQKALTLESKYDFSRFDTSMKSESKVDKKEKAKAKAKAVAEAPAKPVMSGFAVVAWILCMALLFAIVYSYMMLTETSDRVSKLQSELTTMREETQMLEIKKEQKYGTRRLQEIAVNDLGMQKIQRSQITYVNTNTGDYTEVAQPKTMKSDDSTILAGIARGFNTIVEYMN